METREERGGKSPGGFIRCRSPREIHGIHEISANVVSSIFEDISYSGKWLGLENFPSFHLIFFLEKKKERRKYRFLNFINIKYQ